jgi:lipopolysaccharide assembly protein A
MRWLHLTTVIILVVATVIFALQNLEMVSIDFLSFGIRIPLAFLVAAVYLVGMATGSAFLALIRRSIAGAGIGELGRSAR